MTRRTLIVLMVVAAYVAAVTVVPLLDKLVVFPSVSRIDPGSATQKLIPLERGELEIWTATSAAARVKGSAASFVLRFYGNADRAERWVATEAEMFPDREVEVWGVNYPGFGGSTGPARLARIGPAVLAAFDELKRTAGERPIIVSGTSFGTIAALHVVAERDAAGVVLHNPPALREMIFKGHGWWNLWLLAGPLSWKVPTALDSLANARAANERAVFLLAENDEIVAPRFQELVVNAYAGDKRLINLGGAGHLTPLDAEALVSLRAGIDWLVPADVAIAGVR
ncbi:MAG TPA: alpha/beta fold hydrolase [Chthoniobacterales bacterium]|nr:alpha/beta fold hydrolase [Chthoniobacterales bacterium]